MIYCFIKYNKKIDGDNMLNEFINTITNSNLEVHGITILQDSKLIACHDFIPVARHPIYSATKSFTSTALGIAMDETNISLEDNLLKYFEEDLPKDCTREMLENLSKITIKRLLTMSVYGYPFRPEGNDWLCYSLSVQLKDVEKEVFDYSNIPAYLVGVIVEKVVGQNLLTYLKPRLFEPLGIIDPECQVCPSGHFYGASGMYLTVEELAKLGQLYLRKGMWNGKQLLSSQWVQEATNKQIETREGGYGYFFWRCADNGYRISGKWGQRCYVYPDKNLVIAYLSNLYKDEDSKVVSRYVHEYIYSQL
jgi:CubicO group peptidase (beta-lactamase class C family)